MTTTPPPVDREGPDRTADRAAGGIDLGVSQVAASALAAVTSAVAASTLGVAGTIVGAGLGAVVATVGSALYTHSLRRAGDRLRELKPVDDGRWPMPRPRGSTRPAAPDAEAPSTTAAGTSAPDDEAAARRPWKRNAVMIGGGFVVALAVVTGVEGLLGHPLSSSAESGTS